MLSPLDKKWRNVERNRLIMYNIGIIGNGFVGSAIASGFSLHAEIKIFDSDKRRSTHGFSETINNSDFVFVCVPTPMNMSEGGKIDLSIMESVFDNISAELANKNAIFIIKSTTVPGSVESLVDRHPDLNIVYSPEFLTERSARLDFINASRIVLGGEYSLLHRVEALFRSRFPHKKIIKTDTTTAQFIKYMANCFFATKVSFMNEMKQAADKLDVNWQQAVAGLVTDGRVGNSHLDVPGHDGSLGFGGKCFPKDLNGFISLFDSCGVDPKVMKAVWEKNLEVREEHDWKDIKGAVS